MKWTDNVCVCYRFAAKFKGYATPPTAHTHFSLSNRDSSRSLSTLPLWLRLRLWDWSRSVCLWPAPEHFSKLKRAINRRFWPGQQQQQQEKDKPKPSADRLLIIWIIKLSIPLLMMPRSVDRRRRTSSSRGRGKGTHSEDRFNLALIERTIRLSLTVRKLDGKPCSICMTTAWGIGSSSEGRGGREEVGGRRGINLSFS